jgi:hypothetical protein
MSLAANGVLAATSTNNASWQTRDTSLSRYGSGEWQVGTGTANASGSLRAATLRANTSLIVGSSGTAVTAIYSASASLNFGTISSNSAQLTITVTGAATGGSNTVVLGVPGAFAGYPVRGWVSGANTVTVEVLNANGLTTAANTWRATVIVH